MIWEKTWEYGFKALGWAGVSACWSCGELEEGRGSGRPDQQLASTRSQPNPPNRFSDPKIISRSSRGQHFPVNALDPLLTAWWGQCGKPRTSSRLAFFLLLWCSWCGRPVHVRPFLSQKTHFVIWPRSGVPLTCYRQEWAFLTWILQRQCIFS